MLIVGAVYFILLTFRLIKNIFSSIYNVFNYCLGDEKMELDELYKKLNFYKENKKFLDKDTLYKIEKNFDIDFTYHSTTIEGNTLTLVETKTLIEDNISIGGKKLRELYEVTNHNKAFEYVKESIKNNEKLNENKINDIHEILMENIFQGGVYRNTDVYITGASHEPPSPNEMYSQLRFFYDNLIENGLHMNPIELASWTHAEFVRIHPFLDGNGRCARLILNYQLMINGFLPINIKVEDKVNYYESLDLYATKGDISSFMELVLELENKRLDKVNNTIKYILKNKL